MTKETKGLIATLTGGIMWGLSGACGEYLMVQRGYDPLSLTGLRMLVAGVVMLIYLLLFKQDDLKQFFYVKRNIVDLVLFAIFGLFGCQISYLSAIKYTNAGTATVFSYLAPVFIVIFICLKEKRLPTLREISATLFAVLGTFFIATHGDIRTLAITPKGLIWGLISGVAVSFYSLFPVKLLQRVSSLVVIALAMCLGGFVLFFVHPFYVGMPPLDTGVIIALVGLIGFGTILGFNLYLVGLHLLGPIKASLLSSIETVSAVFFSFIALGTQFKFMDFVGFACIMSTVFILNVRLKRKENAL
ncbi:DMT family transporter [Guggenheimella bovis]